MPLWATLLVAVLSSGLLGTALGGAIQGRRERKTALHTRALDEITDFSDGAPGWFELVDIAIRERYEDGGEQESSIRSVDAALRDARRRVGRLVVAVGGPDPEVARSAIGIVSSLELAMEEIRDWPPEVEDDPELNEMTEMERGRAYDEVLEMNIDEALDEARMWLDMARKMFGREFSREAAQHLAPTLRQRVDALLNRRAPDRH